jgi:segregation and condensation protein A
MSLNYRIDLPAFTGPFDLLLHLIERETLDITAISLAQVTAQYLAQVETLKQNRIEQLIDFLVVAARLLLIKSRALLPQPPAVPAGEEEEDPAEALVRQLRAYKRFKEAASWLRGREEAGLRTYLRVAPPPRPQVESRLDLSGVTIQSMINALLEVLARSETREESVTVIQPRRVTIEGQLRHVRRRIRERDRLPFRELLSTRPDRVEIAVTLLAILELMKRQEIYAQQDGLFGPIEILANHPTSDSKVATTAE